MPQLSPQQSHWMAQVSDTLKTKAVEEEVTLKASYGAALRQHGKVLVQASKLQPQGAHMTSLVQAQKAAKERRFGDALEHLSEAGASAAAVAATAPRAGDGAARRIGTEPQTLHAQPLGERYRDEQYQLDADGKVARGGEFHGTRNTRTKYFDDSERRDSRLQVDDDGKLLDASGTPLDAHAKTHYGAEKAKGYVVDAQSGQAHHFKQEDSEPLGEHRLNTHHSSPIGGRDAAAAGNLQVKRGVVREIDDISGHYTPEGKHTHQFVEALHEQGVQTRNQRLSMLDAEGKPAKPTAEVRAMWDAVAEYDEQRRKDKTLAAQPYSEDMRRNKQRLQELGVAPRQKDAKVTVVKGDQLIAEVEWQLVQGDTAKICELVADKANLRLPDPDIEVLCKKANSLRKVNDILGFLRRARGVGVPSREFAIDGVERFVQTGGNAQAISGKEEVNAALKKSDTVGAEDGFDRSERVLVRMLLGDSALSEPDAGKTRERLNLALSDELNKYGLIVKAKKLAKVFSASELLSMVTRKRVPPEWARRISQNPPAQAEELAFRREDSDVDDEGGHDNGSDNGAQTDRSNQFYPTANRSDTYASAADSKHYGSTYRQRQGSDGGETDDDLVGYPSAQADDDVPDVAEAPSGRSNYRGMMGASVDAADEQAADPGSSPDAPRHTSPARAEGKPGPRDLNIKKRR